MCFIARTSFFSVLETFYYQLLTFTKISLPATSSTLVPWRTVKINGNRLESKTFIPVSYVIVWLISPSSEPKECCQDDFESVINWNFVIWYTEVIVLVRHDVSRIYINSEDFIRIAMSHVFISVESSGIRVVIRTYAQALVLLQAFPPRFFNTRQLKRPLHSWRRKIRSRRKSLLKV